MKNALTFRIELISSNWKLLILPKICQLKIELALLLRKGVRGFSKATGQIFYKNKLITNPP